MIKDYIGTPDGIANIIIAIILIIGLLIWDKKSPYTEQNIKKLILKHQILKIIGCLPLILAVGYILYGAIFGIEAGILGLSIIRGLEAIVWIALVLYLRFRVATWIVYFLGIGLIIKSTIKVKKYENIQKQIISDKEKKSE